MEDAVDIVVVTAFPTAGLSRPDAVDDIRCKWLEYALRFHSSLSIYIIPHIPGIEMCAHNWEKNLSPGPEKV